MKTSPNLTHKKLFNFFKYKPNKVTNKKVIEVHHLTFLATINAENKTENHIMWDSIYSYWLTIVYTHEIDHRNLTQHKTSCSFRVINLSNKGVTDISHQSRPPQLTVMSDILQHQEIMPPYPKSFLQERREAAVPNPKSQN